MPETIKLEQLSAKIQQLMDWDYTKKGNTNDTCAAKKEQISIWLADNVVNKIIVTMTCSKPTPNGSLNHVNEMILMVLY